MRGEYENLEKSVCIALGRVLYSTKPSQGYRSMIYCIVPAEFRFGRNRDFLAFLLLPLPEDHKMGSALMPIESLFLLPASIQAQIIVKGIRRNETATIETVRKKPLRHGCD